jgi:1-acyl-sn-glycerol-3-phosphate acyltransferase
LSQRKSSIISPDSVAGAILGRIFAFWALIVFLVSLLLFLTPLCTTYWIEDPAGMERFRKISRWWIHLFLFLSGCRIRRFGAENFEKGQDYIVIVNHNSLIDIPISTPEIPGPNRTIAKVSLSKIPLFGLIYKRGSVLVDRKDPDSRRDSYRQMKSVLASGMHMCIYPEGTRNKTNQALSTFHDGAFRLSVDTGAPIVPALLFNTRKVLPAHKTFFFWPGNMEMHFLPPVAPGGYGHKDLKDKLHGIMETYYLAHGGDLAKEPRA